MKNLMKALVVLLAIYGLLNLLGKVTYNVERISQQSLRAEWEAEQRTKKLDAERKERQEREKVFIQPPIWKEDE